MEIIFKMEMRGLLQRYRVGIKCLPSPFVVLGCGRFGNVNRLFERPSQVNCALLNHLPDVFDPVLLVLDARGLERVQKVKSCCEMNFH